MEGGVDGDAAVGHHHDLVLPPKALAAAAAPLLLHALVVTYPLQGHITPALHLSQHLSSTYHVSITLVVTQHLFPKVFAAIPPSIHVVAVPDNLPDDHPRQSNFYDSYDAVTGMEQSVDVLLQELAARRRLPDVIIADTFVAWTHELALKHGICSVALVTTNAAAMVAMASVQMLADAGILPLKRMNGSSEPTEEQLITCLPGLPPLHPRDLPMSLRMPSLSHLRLKFIMAQFREACKAVAVIVNTVEELEGKILEKFEYKAPVFPMGPLLLRDGVSSTPSTQWPAQNDCLPWLDQQAPGSVIYIAFGSIASFHRTQIVEIAHGLEASKRPFLWVIPPNSFGTSVSEVLPDGFTERTGGTGMVITWAPQQLVLSHPAIGGFVTHCGWNSVMESISLGGVPMVCWPDNAEQPLNAKMISEVWKVGICVRRQEDGSVSRDEVRRVVDAVLEDDDGSGGLKSRAAQLRQVVCKAVGERGSSTKNMDKVLDIIRLTSRKQQQQQQQHQVPKHH